MTLTATQLAQRTSLIGASEIAMVLGLHPSKTALNLYAEKVLGVRDEGTRFSRWGSKLEAVVAEAYMEETGIELVADQQTHVHPVHTCIGATPDYRQVGRSKLVECKTGDRFTADKWGEPGTDEVPQHYAAQAVQQMAVCDVDEIDIAVLLGGNDFRIYRLLRDRDVEAEVLARGVAFYTDHIVAQVPPPAVDGEAANEFVRLLYPRNASEVMRQASTEEADSIKDLLVARQELKDAENAVALLESEIKGYIGEAAGLLCPFGTVTWKSAKSGAVSWKKVAEELQAPADLIAKHTGAGSRRFLVSPSKVAV